jgi:fumarate reductase subunit D
MVKRSNESLPWAFFGAGGFVAAFLMPVHIFLFGIAIPLGWIAAPSPDYLHHLISNPLARIYIFGFCALCFLHAAHRIRATLVDTLRVKHLDTALGVLCYGAGIVGALIALIVAIRIG